MLIPPVLLCAVLSTSGTPPCYQEARICLLISLLAVESSVPLSQCMVPFVSPARHLTPTCCNGAHAFENSHRRQCPILRCC
ncbi:hypothetical protein GY45DRAFT_272905 [Cubamyces sp. BRFM 1775]|nr:hypothetical protein GY45DRAFT_272905 [Cubamyces sp. BRFM 1775]